MFLENLQSKMGNSFINGYGDHDRTRVERDWILVFCFFLLLNLINVLFSAYLFLQINKGSIFVVQIDETAKVIVLNLKQLDKTLNFFEEKETKFLELKKNLPPAPNVRWPPYLGSTAIITNTKTLTL